MSKIKDYLAYFFKSTDKFLLALSLASSIFGICMVYSATLNSTTTGFPRDARTMIFAVILGLILAMAISLVDSDIICKLWPVWAGLSILLMVLVFIFGVAPSAREDARTWLNLGLFYFQPSELVKIFFIITFSVHLSMVQAQINKIKNVALLLLHVAVPTGLVMISGDDGSALVFLLIAVGMLFVAGLSWKYFLGGGVLAAAAVPLLWMRLNEFQRARFLSIIHPEDYPTTAYQQNLGLSALANGGLTGQGYLKGAYTQAGTVPEAQNDMIFTAIGEELGLLGCLACLILLNLIIFRIIYNGRHNLQTHSQFLCYGMAFMIGFHVLINVAMCLRIGPVIGITLPFFSAGGSSTLCLYIGLGVVFSVYRSNYNLAKDTNFRLIGVRSPFHTDFSDDKNATSRKVKANTTVQTTPVTGVSGSQFSANKLYHAAKHAWDESKKNKGHKTQNNRKKQTYQSSAKSARKTVKRRKK